MDDYFEEKGIQKEETKQPQSYGGQLAGMANGLEKLALSITRTYHLT